MPFKIGLAKKREEILNGELKRIIPKIIELGVEKVILFGSITKNCVNKSSDIDLIVIQKTDKRFLDRIELFYQHIKPEVAVDILVYTPEEFEKMRKNNQFIKSTLKKGRILYEK